jgi:hypothetical protein
LRNIHRAYRAALKQGGRHDPAYFFGQSLDRPREMRPQRGFDHPEDFCRR